MSNPEHRRLNLLIVEDEFLVREGIVRIVQAEASFNVLPPSPNLETAIGTLQKTQVDVVLLDFNLAGERGISFVRRAKEIGFQGKILIVTGGLTDAEAVGVVRLGAAGIFLKSGSPELLIKAIYRVADGELWLDQRHIRLIVNNSASPQETSASEQISQREIGVLRGVLEGLTNKEIARRLTVSEGTVKGTLQQLFAKAGVSSRSQLVRVALDKYRDLI